MEGFNIVKKGYSPQEVDEYIATLEQVIKSYKEKDNAIKNAIITAQISADNLLKNAKLEIAEYKSHVVLQLKHIYDSIEIQRSRVQEFQEEYNDMLRKYLKVFDESDVAAIYGRIETLEQYLRELNASIEITDETAEPTLED